MFIRPGLRRPPHSGNNSGSRPVRQSANRVGGEVGVPFSGAGLSVAEHLSDHEQRMPVRDPLYWSPRSRLPALPMRTSGQDPARGPGSRSRQPRGPRGGADRRNRGADRGQSRSARAVRRLRASSTPKARSCARYSAAALLGPRQAAEVTVYDDAVEAVVDKSKKVAEQPSVSWCCSPPKPAMPGCSTPLIGSPQGWRETR